MANLNYSAMTKKELETVLKHAVRLSEGPPDKPASSNAKRVIEEVNQELSKRNTPKLKASRNTGKSPSLIWKKTDPHTNTLFHNGEIVAEIILVANHSLTNRDVYDAYVFGKMLSSSFEYIRPARVAVTEKVEQELARGGGRLRGNDDPRGSNSRD